MSTTQVSTERLEAITSSILQPTAANGVQGRTAPFEEVIGGLTALITSHRDQLSHIEDARRALESTMIQFKSGIGDYASVSRELRGVLGRVDAIGLETGEGLELLAPLG